MPETELLLGAALIVLIVVALLWWIRERLQWETVYESTLLNQGEAFALYGALHNEGIRVRIDTPHGAFGFGGPHQRNAVGHLLHTVRVRVHRDDLRRAHEVRPRQ